MAITAGWEIRFMISISATKVYVKLNCGAQTKQGILLTRIFHNIGFRNNLHCNSFLIFLVDCFFYFGKMTSNSDKSEIFQKIPMADSPINSPIT